jgi:methylated-DNA-[protein]-cysteine S-methyltransferase
MIQAMDFSDSRFTVVHHRNVWGEWTFIFEGTKLCGLTFYGESGKKTLASSVKACAYAGTESEAKVRGRTAQVYSKAVHELTQYLAGKSRKFTIPIKLYGTEFQKAVWERVREIPYGKTVSYKQVAQDIGHAGAERSVGNALHNNPLLVIIPCHRVIDARGKLSGYALGTDIKRRLLCMEGAIQNELELE